ncbi:uncharacterized protein A4U43_C08F20510 [Asparagus officinalis]|nr:uncharacterized protein A4U43_C08F20510 [Asparagus officinalis]
MREQNLCTLTESDELSLSWLMFFYVMQPCDFRRWAKSVYNGRIWKLLYYQRPNTAHRTQGEEQFVFLYRAKFTFLISRERGTLFSGETDLKSNLESLRKADIKHQFEGRKHVSKTFLYY